MKIEKDLGNKIKKYRLSRNMSQERFGKRIGISGKSISAYEKGICMPSLKVMEQISIVYGEDILKIIDTNKLLEKVSNLKIFLDELEKDLKRGLSL